MLQSVTGGDWMKLYSFLTKSLRILCVAIAGFLLLINLLYHSSVSYDGAEKNLVEFYLFRNVLLLCFAAAMVASAFFLKDYLVKIKEKHLFLVLAAAYVLMGIYLIGNVDHTLRADALSLSKAARELLNGVAAQRFVKGGYFYEYPHQLGLLLYQRFLYSLANDPGISFLANLGFVLGINYLIFKITDLVFADRLANLIAILMAFGFLPQFFFILFAYGTIPGLFFQLAAFYYGLRFCADHAWRHMIPAALGSCMAVLLRQNHLIGIIALGIYLLLDWMKKPSCRQMVFLTVLLLSVLLPGRCLTSHFLGEAKGAPPVLWVAMGTDLDNQVRGPGWYDGSNRRIFQSADYDSEAASRAGMEKLEKNLQKIRERPGEAAAFFLKKNVSQWCDPLFQSLWSGPLEDCGQYTKTPLLRSLYNKGFGEAILATVMKLYMLVFWGLCLVYLVQHGADHTQWQLPFLLLVGGFLFHTVWEGKSQYIYPYLFGLIPFAAFALSDVFDCAESLLQKESDNEQEAECP